MGEDIIVYKTGVEKPEETTPSGWHRYRWEGDDKVYVKELDCEVVD
jgi:hypothetical protein